MLSDRTLSQIRKLNVSAETAMAVMKIVEVAIKDEVARLKKVSEQRTNSRGTLLEADWMPDMRHFEYGAKLGLTCQEVECCAEEMRLWAVGNANRPVTRKADWHATFLGWMRREAQKFIRQRKFNGGSANGETRVNRESQLGAAGLALKLRREIEERTRGQAEFVDAADPQSDDGRRFSQSPVGGMDRAGQGSLFATPPHRR